MGSVRRILEGRLWVFASCSSTGKVVSPLQIDRDLIAPLLLVPWLFVRAVAGYLGQDILECVQVP